MQKIVEHIEELCATTERVNVPQLGVFYRQYVPAAINPVLFTVSPPSMQLAFDAAVSDDTNVFTSYLAEKEAMSPNEATAAVASGVQAIKNHLREHQFLAIGNFGTLSLNIENKLVFKPNESLNLLPNTFGLPTITAMPIAHRKTVAQHTPEAAQPTVQIQKLEEEKLYFNWNMAAIVVLFLGIMAILQMMQSNFHPASLRLNTASVYSFFDKFYVGNEKPTLNSSDFLPTTATTAVVAENNTAEATTPAVAESTPVVENSTVATAKVNAKKYYIVLGQFGVKRNAEKFAARLKEEHSADVIIRKNPNNKLLLVAYYVSDTESVAQSQLEAAKQKEDAAWIYNE